MHATVMHKEPRIPEGYFWVMSCLSAIDRMRE